MKKLQSRKFWTAIVGAGLVWLNELLGNPLDEESMFNLTIIVLGYIGFQAVEDSAGKFNGKKN